MKKRVFILVVIISMLGFLPAFSTSFEHFDIISETVLSDFPEVGNHPGLYMANGNIGILSKFNDSTRTNKFHLFDSTGKEVFAIESKTSHAFYRASMSSDDRFIGITAKYWLGDDEFQSYFLDYSGTMLFSPVDDFSPLIPSPGFKYFHSVNNLFDGGTQPMVYDSIGNLITILKTDGSYWRLKPINDSILLFQDGDKLKLLSVPKLMVEKEYIIQDIQPPGPYGMNTALSPDGTVYAFSGKDKIAICDLKTGLVNYMEWDYSKQNLILSKKGQYLVCYDARGLHFSVYKFADSIYQKTIDNIAMKPSGSISISHGGPYLSDDFCIINYYYWGIDPGEYRCCLFQFKGENSDTFKPIALDGHLKPAESSDGNDFYLIKPYSKENKHSMLHQVRLKK